MFVSVMRRKKRRIQHKYVDDEVKREVYLHACALRRPRDLAASKQSFSGTDSGCCSLPLWRRRQNDNLLLGETAWLLHHTPTL